MTTQRSYKWLRQRMDDLGYTSLEQVAVAMGINRGNLYRYFTLETSPSIAMLPVFCEVLETDVNTMLRVLKVLKKNQSI